MKNDFTTTIEGNAKGMTEEERARIKGEAAMLAEARELQEAPIKRYLDGAYKVSVETLTPPHDPKGRGKRRTPQKKKPAHVHADGSVNKNESPVKAADDAIREFYDSESDPEESEDHFDTGKGKGKRSNKPKNGEKKKPTTHWPKPSAKRDRLEAAQKAKEKRAKRDADAAENAAKEEARKAEAAAAEEKAEEENAGFYDPQEFTGVLEGEVSAHDPKGDRLPTVSSWHKRPGKVFTD